MFGSQPCCLPCKHKSKCHHTGELVDWRGLFCLFPHFSRPLWCSLQLLLTGEPLKKTNSHFCIPEGSQNTAPWTQENSPKVILWCAYAAECFPDLYLSKAWEYLNCQIYAGISDLKLIKNSIEAVNSCHRCQAWHPWSFWAGIPHGLHGFL